MAISEPQLETWSHPGAQEQSKNTYASIKAVLEDAAAPYPALFIQKGGNGCVRLKAL